jgi:cell division protein FtsX
MALGATRLRIVRQLLLESVTLCLIGAAAGLFIAAWSADYLKTLVPLQLGLAAEDLSRVRKNELSPVSPLTRRISRLVGETAVVA